MAPFPLATPHASQIRALKLVLAASGLLCSSIGGAQGQTDRSPSIMSASQVVRVIPSVIGMPVNAATDSLRWTGLSIVQLPTTTSSESPGIVLRQQPQAGTPVSRAKAETLYVATAPKKPRPKRPSVWDAIAKAVITATQPAPPEHDDVSNDPPTDTTTRVPLGPGRDSAVHGEVYQDLTCLPDLTGRTPQMVGALLRKARLRTGKVFRDYSDEIEIGRVFRQHPLPACEIVTGTSVTLWYSNGPHPKPTTLIVPSVIGLALRDAADSLQRVGLRPGHVDSVTSRNSEGNIIRQLPHEGDAAHPGDAVDLIVAVAPQKVEVPSLIGMSQDNAEQSLQASGLKTGRITLVTVEGRRTGIISQKPQPGTLVDSATLVDIVDNRPPEVRYTEVPDLVGKSLSQSESALKLAGLVVGEVVRLGTERPDEVTDQKPEAGTRVLMRSEVNVALGIELRVVTQLVPDVVNLAVDSARRLLNDSGFTQIAIAGRGDRITSKSIIESQAPAAGTPAPAQTLVSLIARTPPPPPLVPNLVGQRKKAARDIAQLDTLRMIVTSELRRLRLRDKIVSQNPEPWTPRRADMTVDVVAEIPVIPPVLFFGMLGVGAVGGVILRLRPRISSRLVKVTQPPTPPVLDINGRDTLIDTEFTLRFDLTDDPLETECEHESIVKSTEL